MCPQLLSCCDWWDESFDYFRRLHCHVYSTCIPILQLFCLQSSTDVCALHTLQEWQGFDIISPIVCCQFCCILFLSLLQLGKRPVLCLLNSNSCIHLNRQLPLHTSPAPLFLPSSSLTQWWAGHPELFISAKWKSSWILNILSEVVANIVLFFLLLPIYIFFLAKKSRRSLCQAISKVNQ